MGDDSNPVLYDFCNRINDATECNDEPECFYHDPNNAEARCLHNCRKRNTRGECMSNINCGIGINSLKKYMILMDQIILVFGYQIIIHRTIVLILQSGSCVPRSNSDDVRPHYNG